MKQAFHFYSALTLKRTFTRCAYEQLWKMAKVVFLYPVLESRNDMTQMVNLLVFIRNTLITHTLMFLFKGLHDHIDKCISVINFNFITDVPNSNHTDPRVLLLNLLSRVMSPQEVLHMFSRRSKLSVNIFKNLTSY